MKKLVYLLICLFLLSAGFAACSNETDDPPEQPSSHQNETPTDSIAVNNDTTEIDSTEAYTVISAVPASEEVKAFFDEALPKEEGKIADFIIDKHETLWYSYYMIKSDEELRKKYVGNKELPVIDFDKYCVVIAEYPMVERPTDYFLEIHYYGDSVYSLAFCLHAREWRFSGGYNSYIWGVFPKITKDISKIEYVEYKS